MIPFRMLAAQAKIEEMPLATDDAMLKIFDMWCNAEITPWLHLAADIQVVNTALGHPGRSIIPLGFIVVNLPESKAAWIFGLRRKIQF